ncbi:hypothetical protein C5U48_05730 [Mycolicibacter virginiensis]|uniref:Uncharacterized protein n=1 Tax=Mycolicibacter virginiensis TaxID=1795032 RepID=A0A9X7IQA1_9MYCO|nr:hypothetical protein C5U48_05730 [Mycolicibacter virginiensis]
MLFDLKPSDVVGPLSDFQHTNLNDRDDVLKLVTSINEATDQKLPDRQLSIYFDRFWPDLEENLEKIRESQHQPTGGDGAIHRGPEQLMEEVLERVRTIDGRQRMFTTRVAQLSKKIDLLSDTVGAPSPRSASRLFVAMPPFGVGRLVSVSDDFVVVDLPNGRYRMSRGALRTRLRESRLEAEHDFDRMKKEARNRIAHGLSDDPISYENLLEPISESRPDETEDISDDEIGS